MNTDKNKNVINFGQDDPEAVAKATGMKVFEPSQPDVEETPDVAQTRPNRLLRLAGTALAAAGAVWLLNPHIGNNEPPKDEMKSYTELAQESAQQPLTSSDTILIKGIKLNPNDSDRNSGSEAVLGDERVQEFMDENPDEQAAIKSSVNALPATDEYALVERDINGDGEGDAIAVPVEQQSK